jgi:hypothetical protein
LADDAVCALQMLDELELRAPHVVALEDGLLPEERHIDGARRDVAVTDGVTDEDGHETGGERSSDQLGELGVPRVSRWLVRAVTHPQEHLRSRRECRRVADRPNR